MVGGNGSGEPFSNRPRAKEALFTYVAELCAGEGLKLGLQARITGAACADPQALSAQPAPRAGEPAPDDYLGKQRREGFPLAF